MLQNVSSEDTVASVAEHEAPLPQATELTGPQDPRYHSSHSLSYPRNMACQGEGLEVPASSPSLSLLYLRLVPNLGQLCLVGVVWVTCLSPSCIGVWEIKHLTCSLFCKWGWGEHMPHQDLWGGKSPNRERSSRCYRTKEWPTLFQQRLFLVMGEPFSRMRPRLRRESQEMKRQTKPRWYYGSFWIEMCLGLFSETKQSPGLFI